jgi:hypothetical protein
MRQRRSTRFHTQWWATQEAKAAGAHLPLISHSRLDVIWSMAPSWPWGPMSTGDGDVESRTGSSDTVGRVWPREARRCTDAATASRSAPAVQKIAHHPVQRHIADSSGATRTSLSPRH